MALLYKIIIGTNVLLFIFSAGIVGFSAATIYNFDESVDAFFTRGDFAYFLVAGLLGVIISVFGCLGARNPEAHYNLLFCYFFLLSITIMFNAVGFYLYRTFVLNLEAASEGNVENAVRAESAKEFNDFLLSTYVVCCTGCNATKLPNCVENLPVAETSEGYCPTVGLPDEKLDCDLPLVCDEKQLAKDQGLDQGCFINSLAIPAYDVFNNVCVFFDEFAETKSNKPIVGPVEDGSCGNGNPRVFVEDVFSFMTKNYYLIAIFWGFGITISFLAWLGALFILMCPHRYAADSKAAI